MFIAFAMFEKTSITFVKFEQISNTLGNSVWICNTFQKFEQISIKSSNFGKMIPIIATLEQVSIALAISNKLIQFEEIPSDF